MTVPTGNLLGADYTSGTVQGSFYTNTSHWILTKPLELSSTIIFVLQKNDSERLSTLLKITQLMRKKASSQHSEPNSRLFSILPPYEPLLTPQHLTILITRTTSMTHLFGAAATAWPRLSDLDGNEEPKLILSTMGQAIGPMRSLPLGSKLSQEGKEIILTQYIRCNLQ